MPDSPPLAADPRIPTVIRAASSASPGDLIAEEVTFSSPFTDYRGRADVVHLLRLIGRVLHEPIVTGSASDGIWTYTSLTGKVDAHDVEAVLRERHDDAGRLLHATLFLRPYRSLRAAMDAMGRLLAESPLPSAR